MKSDFEKFFVSFFLNVFGLRYSGLFDVFCIVSGAKIVSCVSVFQCRRVVKTFKT